MTRTAITASGLVKGYGDRTVLDGIDLDVAAGTVFALLGPNGAGKTTTVNVLTTLTRADGGTARVAGHDVATETRAVRAAIGVTGQFAAVDELLTGRENLRLVADLKRMGSGESRRIVADLLERFDLTDAADKRASTYSGGMRRKLDLAMTLVGAPEIIFLDEPTTGLDPRSRRTMWEIIRRLVADGVTIFLTTQYLEEADRLADRIAVLDHGTLVAQGTPAELKRRIPGSHVRLRFAGDPELEAAHRVLTDATRDEEDLVLRVPSDGGARSVRVLLERLDADRVEIEEFSVHTPDLDDVFLALTGRDDTKGGTTMSNATTMLGRNVKHTTRNPTAVFNAVLFPIVIMLMFVFVFGGALAIPGSYIDYATPGMIVLAVCYGLSATALSVNSDMTKGIINRFKVMDIPRSAVLSAHVAATMVRSLIAIAALVAVAFALGFRPAASAVDWLGVVGLVVLVSFATSWLTVALGLFAKSPESAGMATVPLIMLPFLSSAIVPAGTMGPGVRQFAEYQPFTPIIETLRGLLAGAPDAGSAIVAAVWCVVIALVGYVWSLSTFAKRA